MSTINTTEGLGRTPARPTRRNGGHGIRDVDLPQSRTAIPLADLADEFARWNHGIERARNAYHATKKTAAREDGIDYIARTKASEKQLRYRARKKEQQNK